MTESAIQKGTTNILVLLVPFAFGVVLLSAAWRWLLGALAVGIALQVWQQYQWQRLSDRLSPDFNALLRDNQGCLTAVDLAIRADVPIGVAQRFLVQQTERYGGQQKLNDTQNPVYYFLTASALTDIFAEDTSLTSEASKTIDVEALDEEEIAAIPSFQSVAAPQSAALIQAELAKRLSVHSGTLTKRKNDPSFPEWSCKKDPDGVAWRYAPKQKVFIPLDLSPE